MIIQPQSTSCPPAVPAHAPTLACTPRCFGYRDILDSTALPMQSPAVARSRPLTVCGSVTVCVRKCESKCACARHPELWISQPYPGFSPSSQSSAIASPGPDNACARSTSRLCRAVSTKTDFEARLFRTDESILSQRIADRQTLIHKESIPSCRLDAPIADRQL